MASVVNRTASSHCMGWNLCKYMQMHKMPVTGLLFQQGCPLLRVGSTPVDQRAWGISFFVTQGMSLGVCCISWAVLESFLGLVGRGALLRHHRTSHGHHSCHRLVNGFKDCLVS